MEKPKTKMRHRMEVSIGREILRDGDAVAYFNIGTSAVFMLFDALGIPPGKFTEAGCQQLDQICVHLAQRTSQDDKKEEKFLGAKEKRKMKKEWRQKVPTMPLDILNLIFCVEILVKELCKLLKPFFQI